MALLDYFNRPGTRLGLGILAGNIGRSGSEAFSNAMAGGANALSNWQMMDWKRQQMEMQRQQMELQQQLQQFQLQQAQSQAAREDLSRKQLNELAQDVSSGTVQEAYSPSMFPGETPSTLSGQNTSGLLNERVMTPGDLRAGMLGIQDPEIQAGMLNQIISQNTPLRGKDRYIAVDDQLFDINTGRFTRPSGLGGPGGLTRSEMMSEYNLGEYTGESVINALKSGDPRVLKERAKLSDEQSIRKEIDANVKAARKAIEAGKSLDALLSSPGAMQDTAAVYQFIKLLDPESVVREGEISLTQGAMGVWQQLQSLIQKTQGEGFLTDRMRRDLRSTINLLVGEYKKSLDQTLNHYRSQLGDSYEWERISPPAMDYGFLNSGNPQPTTQGAPPLPPAPPAVDPELIEELKRRGLYRPNLNQIPGVQG